MPVRRKLLLNSQYFYHFGFLLSVFIDPIDSFGKLVSHFERFHGFCSALSWSIRSYLPTCLPHPLGFKLPGTQTILTYS